MTSAHKSIVITIPPNTAYVDASEASTMIADTLAPIISSPKTGSVLSNLIKQVPIDDVYKDDELTEEDWKLLDTIWSALPNISSIITAKQYKPYLEAFNAAASSPDAPISWKLKAYFINQHEEEKIRWMNVKSHHWWALNDAAFNKKLVILDGIKRSQINRIEHGSVLSVEHFREYLKGYGIELKEFLEERPKEKPSETEMPSETNNNRSDKLSNLMLASAKFWKNANPDDKMTHPKSQEVIAWLMKQGFSENLAKSGASIIRPEWASEGRPLEK